MGFAIRAVNGTKVVLNGMEVHVHVCDARTRIGLGKTAFTALKLDINMGQEL